MSPEKNAILQNVAKILRKWELLYLTYKRLKVYF